MERNYAIDFIKFFAIAAVVVIHTFPADHKLGYFIIDNFTRFSVPFFFTASGYFFGMKVSKNPDSTAYFKRYALKILKLYISWLVFYMGYDVLRILLTSGGDEHEVIKYFEELTWRNLLYYGEGTSGYQLWFVIALVWSIAVLYLFFRLRQLNLLLVISLCFNLLGLFGQSYSYFFELPVDSTRDALFLGLFYTTAGCWFSVSPSLKNPFKIRKRGYFYLFCLFIIVQAAEGYWLEKWLHARHGEFFISTIFLTVFLFCVSLNFPRLGKGLFITKIGANALGIYTVHVFIIDMVDMLYNASGLKNVTHIFFWNVIDAFLVFGISLVTFQFIQSIKEKLEIGTAQKIK